jgi:hypothetical protein
MRVWPISATALINRLLPVLVLSCVASQAQTIPLISGPVLPLYRELYSVGLDPQQVYHVREADIDREDVHLSLNDGTIAFTTAIDGRVTGAFFEGEGEVLVRPPNRMERASLGLFTGTGVLEEKFVSAYFRFNDDTARQLQPFLRPAEDAPAFVARNNTHAQTLASMDAMRLCISFTSQPRASGPGQADLDPDQFLHARVAGEQHGVFDVYFDTLGPEQVVVGKTSAEHDEVYYDLWMSFPMTSVRKTGHPEARFQGPTGPAWTRDVLKTDKYTIVARLDALQDLSMEATLDVYVKQGGNRVVLFELSRYLQLKRVEVGGNALEFIQNEAVQGSDLARRGNDLVAVVFPAPLTQGQRFLLSFRYSGSVLADAGGGLLYVGARGIWYPNRGIAMANYDLTFRYPQPWTLVATGKQVSLEPDGNFYVGHWVSETPIPVAGFNVGRYQKASARAGTVAVNSYAADVDKRVPTLAAATPVVSSPPSAPGLPTAVEPVPQPAGPAGSGQLMADNAAATLSAFEQMLRPYAFGSLELTERPGRESQGWPGLIFLSNYVYMTPEELTALKTSPSDELIYREVMLSHEIGHQWFGDEISWASYHEQWLMEALANYSALMLLERTHPADVQSVLETYRRLLATKSKSGRPFVEAGPVTLGVRLSSSKFHNGYEFITYGRGTWLIHMLRNMLRDTSRTAENPDGDDKAFLALLRDLVDRYQGKEITNEEFQQAVENFLPRSVWYEDHKSLDWFFDGWVNGTAFPQLELSDVKSTSHGGFLSFSGVIQQRSAPVDLVTSVPVYGLEGDRKVYLGRVFAEGEETHFKVQAPVAVKHLVLDPYQTVLTAPH